MGFLSTILWIPLPQTPSSRELTLITGWGPIGSNYYHWPVHRYLDPVKGSLFLDDRYTGRGKWVIRQNGQAAIATTVSGLRLGRSKWWGACDTTHGHKAKEITASIAWWGEAWTEAAIVNHTNTRTMNLYIQRSMTGTVIKATMGKLVRNGVGWAYKNVGLPECVYIPSSTELCILTKINLVRVCLNLLQ